jgi:hypothetical protein
MGAFGAFHTPPPPSTIPARPPFVASPPAFGGRGFRHNGFEDFGGSHHGWGRSFASPTIWPGWWGGGYYGYGYDSGVYAPTYVSEAAPPPPPAMNAAAEPETPICPEIIHWSAKLGHETRTKLCS